MGYHRRREERDPIVRKAIPCVRFGNDRRSVGRGERGAGDRLEVVSRESPVVIVVIKWRFASVVCILRGSEGNTGWERSRGTKEAKGIEEERQKERGLVFVIGGAEWRSIWNTPQWNKLHPCLLLTPFSLTLSPSLPHSVSPSSTLRSPNHSRLHSFTLERFHPALIRPEAYTTWSVITAHRETFNPLRISFCTWWGKFRFNEKERAYKDVKSLGSISRQFWVTSLRIYLLQR